MIQDRIDNNIKDLENKIKALANHLGCENDEIKDSGDNRFEYGNQEYLVLTDDESNKACEKDINQYIEDCILSNLPEPYRVYFNRDAFINDAQHYGRGNSLASYDGAENEEDIDGITYFIYRTN